MLDFIGWSLMLIGVGLWARERFIDWRKRFNDYRFNRMLNKNMTPGQRKAYDMQEPWQKAIDRMFWDAT